MAQTGQFRFKQLGIDNGLSHPDVRVVLKDSRGFVWVGTGYGLNRFDGYMVKTFYHDPRDSTSLINDQVYRLFESPEGYIVVRTGSGLVLYDPVKENFIRNLEPFYARYGTSQSLINIVRHRDGSFWFVEPNRLIRYDPEAGKGMSLQNINGDSSSIVGERITDFVIDKGGNNWLIHANGIIERVETKTGIGRVVQRITSLSELNRNIATEYRMMCDMDDDIWLWAPGLSQGIFHYDTRTRKLNHVSTNTGPVHLNADAVSQVTEAADGTIWVGTDHGGVNIIDKNAMTIRYVLHREGDATSVAENSVTWIYRDDKGIMWVGTYKRGVSFYHENIYRFDLYKRYALDPASLPFEDINAFAEDAKGNLWIGTNGGGLLHFDRQHERFNQYLHDPDNKSSLSSNVIVDLFLDSDQILWIGTYKGGLSKFDGSKFTTFKPDETNVRSIPSENIWKIFEDSRNRMWLGTIDYGAVLFDKNTGNCERLSLWGPNAMQSPTVVAIDEDRHGNIWFGTTNGIDVLSKDGTTFRHYGASSEPDALMNNFVMDFLRDSRDRFWIATFDGLSLFEEASNGFKTFHDNRPHKAILTIEEDDNGCFWMGTFDGLLQMKVSDTSDNHVLFKRYTETDGLQGRQFNQNAGIKTRKGEIVFGGPTGFNIVNGMDRHEEVTPTRIVLSELELYEKPVGIGEVVDGVVVLDKAISEADKITLPPNRNFFSISLSALNYFNPERDRYMYQLEGLSKDWLPVPAKSHEIIFNNLHPGSYKLRVKTVNGDGIWSDEEASLAIIIQPPFWKTNIAFTLYATFLLVILFIARKMIQQREKLKFALEHERRETQRVHEMDMMKVKFFTNVSHEFRTPLTLILTPIERLIKKATDPDQIVQFQLIQRNGRRLMTLVNQLLDFKKLEVHDIKLSPAKGDIVSFVRDTALSFSDLSEKKNIRLEFSSSVDHLEALFDQDKLEKILFNLLSNAFKFTLEKGVVSVRLELVKEGSDQMISIAVKDTGIGIPQDKIDSIFEPFFQTDLPKSIINIGSGIGLSITKEFVRIHGGRIEVESEIGKGSCFRFSIPLVQSGSRSEQILNGETSASVMPAIAPEEETLSKTAGKSKKKSLLLVEDNDDFRFYLKDNLKFEYEIYEAENGLDGWDTVVARNPDLIVSDIMMPELNGIDLCTKIKSDERFSHIPVILLTARSNEEQRLEGFKTGADDYITKPFNFEVLEARINNLLRQREKSQKTFRKTLAVKSSELQITPLDVKFIENAVKCVEQNVSSPEFSVEDLGTELGISRAYVFKKILALTGKTPLEFIRTIRLQHAAQLLERSQLSVREIAYKVGFNNPKYFTKYFKEQFHVLPSEYADLKKNEGDQSRE